MKRSFVFGNGRTRLNMGFDEVKPYGLIYACNAVYRDFSPDYLVAVDSKMVNEINESKFQLTNQVWTNYIPSYKNYEKFNYFEPNLGWSSGPTALNLATSHRPDEVYIFGFDYEGLKGKINNVYANTNNYKKSTDPATYHGNWLRQTEKIIKDNATVNYYRVNVENFFDPPWRYDNYKRIFFNEFRDIMSTWNIIR
jgi:hypothetical protein